MKVVGSNDVAFLFDVFPSCLLWGGEENLILFSFFSTNYLKPILDIHEAIFTSENKKNCTAGI